MNRGYSGFYNGYFLRSSYEYAYAKYLDYYSIPWDYESQKFEMGFKVYKPDFLFYDQNGNIKKIVEIKSRNKKEKLIAKTILDLIEKKYNIECELVSYEELLVLYKTVPFSLTSTITEWVNSDTTKIHKAAFGELNGHYNINHSNETKRKIGKHTKKLWLSDTIAKQRMVEGLRNSGLAQKGKWKRQREMRNCLECGRGFEVIVTSSQKFCSRSCAGNTAIQLATQSYMSKRNQVHRDIRDYVIQWSRENKEIVLATPLNKIKTTLQPLIDNIHALFGVKDFRVISRAVFGEDRGRKELLRFMKSMCDENIC